MSSPILHAGAAGLCPHGGALSLTTSQARVRVSGQPVFTTGDASIIAGCGFNPGAYHPCVNARWITAATRVRVLGLPVVLRDGQALALAADQAPQGAPTLTTSQVRARAVARRRAPGGTSVNIAFPFQVQQGRSALADESSHLRHLIEQVLFTAQGERVDRPDFGCGVDQLVFGPSSPEVSSAAQVLVQGALQQWLGDVAQIDRVAVESDDAALRVTVQYTARRSGARFVSTFSR